MIDVGKKEEEEVEDLKSKMKVKETEDELILEFTKTHPTIVNSIRRVILNDVPVFAVEEVVFNKNDSGLYDEVIAHRLGLVPLKTDFNNYNLRDECKCGGVGCALCEVNFSLQKQEPGFVYSGDMKSDDPAITPVYENIPITKLIEEQNLEFTAKATLGKGRVHAKWTPAHSYISENNEKILLHVEGFGQLDNKIIYNKAIEILQTNLDRLKEAFKEENESKE